MLTHRRQSKNIDTGYVLLFAEGGNEHYGNHVWALEEDLPSVTNDVVLFAEAFYNIDREEAESLVNPSNIVDSAGAWDDPTFVSDLWQAMESGLIEESPGFKTWDGAVVLDRFEVKLRYYYEG